MFFFFPCSQCSWRASASLHPRAHKGLEGVERHETQHTPATLAASPPVSLPINMKRTGSPAKWPRLSRGTGARPLQLLFLAGVQVCWLEVKEGGGVACSRRPLAGCPLIIRDATSVETSQSLSDRDSKGLKIKSRRSRTGSRLGYKAAVIHSTANAI